MSSSKHPWNLGRFLGRFRFALGKKHKYKFTHCRVQNHIQLCHKKCPKNPTYQLNSSSAGRNKRYFPAPEKLLKPILPLCNITFLRAATRAQVPAEWAQPGQREELLFQCSGARCMWVLLTSLIEGAPVPPWACTSLPQHSPAHCSQKYFTMQK